MVFYKQVILQVQISNRTKRKHCKKAAIIIYQCTGEVEKEKRINSAANCSYFSSRTNFFPSNTNSERTQHRAEKPRNK